MFPTHNIPTGQPSLYRSEQVSSTTGQQPPTPSMGEGPRPEGRDVTERLVSHPQQPAAPEAAVVTITKEQIPSEWKTQLKQNLVYTLDQLKLSPHHLEMLNEARLITTELQQEAEAAKSEEQCNFMLLSALKNNGAEITWAKFLNFLNQTRAEVASHGALFDKLCKIHNIAGASVCSPSVQPAAVFSQPQIPAAPVEPVATPQPEAPSTVADIQPDQIHEDWQERLKDNWVNALKHLQLSYRHLALLYQKRFISDTTLEQATEAINNRKRNSYLLNHVMHCCGKRGYADFLNFLNQTRRQVASHGVLFDKLCREQNIASASVCSPLLVQSAVAPSQPHIQTAPVVSPRQQPVAVRLAPVMSHTPLQQAQTAPEPMDSTPSVPQPVAPHHRSLSPSVAYKQILAGKLRPYLQRKLQAKNIRNRLLSNDVISYPLYKAIKQASSSQQANELLIAFIEQAADAAPWNGLLKILQLEDVQCNWPILQNVSDRMSAAAATTATSVALQEPTFSQKTAASTGIVQDSDDQQPLAPHQKVLREKWVYLVDRPIAKSIVDELFQKGFSYDLYERISKSVETDANELLLEYLYEADSDKPWKDFMEVLGSAAVQQDYPILEEVHSTLMEAFFNSR